MSSNRIKEKEVLKMQAVLMSIQPKWCEMIANGKKTIEVRKTRPKRETPFKCYIYCTSIKALNLSAYCEIHAKTGGHIDDWNGKVIGEFVCKGIGKNNIEGLKWWDMLEHLLKCSCLKMSELQEYVANKIFYTWSIDNLVIYDKPKELSVFNLTRPPQSWCYIRDKIDM